MEGIPGSKKHSPEEMAEFERIRIDKMLIQDIEKRGCYEPEAYDQALHASTASEGEVVTMPMCLYGWALEAAIKLESARKLTKLGFAQSDIDNMEEMRGPDTPIDRVLVRELLEKRKAKEAELDKKQNEAK